MSPIIQKPLKRLPLRATVLTDEELYVFQQEVIGYVVYINFMLLLMN